MIVLVTVSESESLLRHYCAPLFLQSPDSRRPSFTCFFNCSTASHNRPECLSNLTLLEAFNVPPSYHPRNAARARHEKRKFVITLPTGPTVRHPDVDLPCRRCRNTFPRTTDLHRRFGMSRIVVTLGTIGGECHKVACTVNNSFVVHDVLSGGRMELKRGSSATDFRGA